MSVDGKLVIADRKTENSITGFADVAEDGAIAAVSI
jgi:hypothetical protein